MGEWYQEPDCLAPLAADEGSGDSPSDHLTVIMEPIDVLNNKPARIKREDAVGQMKQSSIDLFGFWIKGQDWKEIFEAKHVDDKTERIQTVLLEKVDEFFPQKLRVISSDDQPFCTEEMKHLKRQKSREYSKHRKSLKWRDLSKKYEKAVKKAKQNFYKKFVKDLKQSKVGQWYSKLKRVCSFDQHKNEPIIVESIKHLSDKEQAEKIADKFSKNSQEFDQLKTDDIKIPEFDKSTVPRISPKDVLKHLRKVKTNRAVPPGDIPPNLIKLFANELAIPLCHIINSSIKDRVWGEIYKSESVTPVPKVYPPHTVNDLRNLSGLLTFDKITEKNYS